MLGLYKLSQVLKSYRLFFYTFIHLCLGKCRKGNRLIDAPNQYQSDEKEAIVDEKVIVKKEVIAQREVVTKNSSNVLCEDHVTVCDTGTCCKKDETHYMCCQLTDAVCCEDDIHCCPKDFVCLEGGT